VPDVFKALSDPTRREILMLLRRGDLTAGAIAENFAMSKPSVSHHLSALKAVGLVNAERRGQEIVYSLDTTVFQDVVAYLLQMFGSPEGGDAR
jgi:ArsR family transcriptional regulator, arsenate/arsenite/antimonite-responsive transcriptional repressor